MTKLAALLGVLQGVKAKLKEPRDGAYKDFQRPALFNGFVRTYRPLDEENGERFPDEGEIVQLNVEGVLAGLVNDWARLIDVQATVDATNQAANGALFIPDAAGAGTTFELPASTLIWLEKQLTDLHTLVSKAPEVNPTKAWTFDPASGDFRTPVRTSVKTRKVPKALVLYPHSDKFPAQVQAYNEDETIGHWDSVDYSGAVMPTRKRQILDRIDTMREQVKVALADANTTEALDVKMGTALLTHLLRQED